MGFQAERAPVVLRPARSQRFPPRIAAASAPGSSWRRSTARCSTRSSRDGFQVLEQRMALTPLRKLWIAWKTWVALESRGHRGRLRGNRGSCRARRARVRGVALRSQPRAGRTRAPRRVPRHAPRQRPAPAARRIRDTLALMKTVGVSERALHRFPLTLVIPGRVRAARAAFAATVPSARGTPARARLHLDRSRRGDAPHGKVEPRASRHDGRATPRRHATDRCPAPLPLGAAVHLGHEHARRRSGCAGVRERDPGFARPPARRLRSAHPRHGPVGAPTRCGHRLAGRARRRDRVGHARGVHRAGWRRLGVGIPARDSTSTR